MQAKVGKKCNLVLFRISSDRHLRNLARQDSASISGSKTPYLQIGITLPFQDTLHQFRMTWLIFCAVKFQFSMFDESSQQCCQLPRARKSKLASGYTLIRIAFPFQDTFHHFRTRWLIFCAVKFQVSMFNESSQLPRARKSKLASGYTLIKIHFTWTCILVLDLCSVHIRCAARASGLACVSVRCAAARHERRAAVALQ